MSEEETSNITTPQEENRAFKDITWEGNILDFIHLKINTDKIVRIVKLGEGKYSLRLTL